VSGSDFAIIGPGRLGRALLARLQQVGWRCVAVRARSSAVAGTLDLPATAVVDDWDNPRRWSAPPVLLLTVPDRQIRPVAERMAAELDLIGRVVLHTSGLLDADEAGSCRAAGAAVGSWHPLLSVGDPAPTAASWEAATCAVEGDPAAVETGRRVAAAIGLWAWTIRPEDKPRYHAAAALAGNITHLCIVAARLELQKCALPPGTPFDPLRALVETSVNAAFTARELEGLTGAIARGDAATIARHLDVLPRDLADAYAALARWFQARREHDSD